MSIKSELGLYSERLRLSTLFGYAVDGDPAEAWRRITCGIDSQQDHDALVVWATGIYMATGDDSPLRTVKTLTRHGPACAS